MFKTGVNIGDMVKFPLIIMFLAIVLILLSA